MENNLQPVKCTIIENKNKNLTKEEEPEQGQTSEERLLENNEKEKEIEKKMQEVHEEYRNIWLNVLKDLQRKRLHEVEVRVKIP